MRIAAEAEKNNMKRRATQPRQATRIQGFGILLALATIIFGSAAYAQAAIRREVKIDAQPVAAALKELAAQTGLQILVMSDAAGSKQAPAIKGNLTNEEALDKILRDTGLTYQKIDDNTVAIRPANTAPQNVQPKPTSQATGVEDRFRVARVDQGPTASDSSVEEQDEPASHKKPVQLDEVMVTGSRIRGAQPTSPLHSIDRGEIDQSGYSQIGDLMRSLPENFSGGANPGVIAAGAANGENRNNTNAVTLNLRGLGSGATLVLLNGHRLAPDYSTQGVDISGIPLAAVEKIEIVTDGASALYGSEAIAGVANIIMRQDYNGTELSARVGDTTQGGGMERTYSVLSGMAKDGANGLINLEYSKQDAISAYQRDSTSAVTPETSLMQPQERTSAFLKAGMDFSDRLSLSVDGLYSHRDASYVSYATVGTNKNVGWVRTPSYNVAANLDFKASRDWGIHLTGVTSENRNVAHNDNVSIGFVADSNYKNSLRYLELSSDGVLAMLPTGAVRLAAGGGYREEAYDYNSRGGYHGAISSVGAPVDTSRNVRYLFAETLIPLVTSSAERSGLHELDLSVAGRTERYSDFGSSSNPKVGFRYVPLTGLTLRGSWGKSFKAPSFNQTSGFVADYLYPASFFGSRAGGIGLMSYGRNPLLDPERAKSWTFGGEFSLPQWNSLTLSADYFNVDYTDRVVQPVLPYTAALVNPIFAPFIIRNPSPQQQAATIAATGNNLANESGVPYDPATVVALIENVYTNAAAQSAHGIDLAYRQTFRLSSGELSTFANATWLRLDQQTLPTTPDVVISGRIAFPPDLKARAGASWTYRRMSLTGAVNYVASETDTGVLPYQHIGSWTTVDSNLSYSFDHSAGALSNVRVTAFVSNLLDKGPPYAASPALSYAGIHYDSTNASIVGRFVALQASKKW